MFDEAELRSYECLERNELISTIEEGIPACYWEREQEVKFEENKVSGSLGEKDVKERQGVEWEEPRLIDLQKAMPLSREMLPKILTDYVFDGAKSINNGSPEYVAVSIIIAAASLIGCTALIAPKRNDKGWKIHPVLWGLVIGGPSSYKTPLMKLGLEPLIRAQEDVIDVFNEKNINEQEAKNAVIEKKMEQLKQKLKEVCELEDDEQIRSVNEELSSLKVLSNAKREVVVNDATPEAFTRKLAANPLGVLLFRDEMSGAFAYMNKQGREQERALYLEGFNATRSKYVMERVGSGSLTLEMIFIAMLGGIQPQMFKSLLLDRQRGKSDDGFIERFQLAVWPDMEDGQYTDISLSSELKEEVYRVFRLIAQLGTLEKVESYNFDEEAQDLWDDWSKGFHNSVNGLSESDQSMEMKYPALVAKLALVFQIIYEADKCTAEKLTTSRKVSASHLTMALHWLDFLRSHSRKIQSLVEDQRDPSVVSLLTKLSSFDGSFTKHQLSQKCWKFLKTKEERDRALSTLEQSGYIKKVTKPKMMYMVHPDYCQVKN